VRDETSVTSFVFFLWDENEKRRRETFGRHERDLWVRDENERDLCERMRDPFPNKMIDQ
jgi:hypothetical protein